MHVILWWAEGSFCILFTKSVAMEQRSLASLCDIYLCHLSKPGIVGE